VNDTRPIRDIEDNYPSYVDETLGYSYDVWDVIPASIRQEHDRILHLATEDLEDQKTVALPDVARWALARRLRDVDDLHGFLDIALALTKKTDLSPGLSMHDICLAGALSACVGAPERVDSFIDALGQNSPMLGFIRAAAVLATNEDQASQLFEEWHQDDPESAFDVAQYLCSRGFVTLGLEWIERTRQAALKSQKRSVLIDIALLEESLKNEG
jgi:hypothetical protein